MMEQSREGAQNINATLFVTHDEAAAGITKIFQSEVWDLPTGSYSFTATAPFNGKVGTVLIHAVGSASDGDREDIRTADYPDFHRDNTHPEPISAGCFSYAMFSRHNLKINGDPTVLGGGGLWANGDIIFEGVTSTVEGPVMCTGQIYGSTVQPPAPDGSAYPCAGGQSPRAMPRINLTFYETHAEVVEHATWTSWTGGLTGSTDRLAPKIYFVDGKVRLAGKLSGWGIIVATKGIEVVGNATYSSPESDGWAFVTPGYLKVVGTAQINGSVYCHNATGEAQFLGTGTPNIYGGVVADVITIGGAYLIEYDDKIKGMSDLPGTLYFDGPPIVDTLFWERA